MAIKVVQGLIDVTRGEVMRSQAAVQGNVPQPNSALAHQRATSANQITQSLNFVQQQATAVQAAVQSVVQDASLSIVRSRAASSDARLRDPETAKKVANSVADQVRGGLEDGAVMDVHPELTVDSARQHFSR